MVQNGVKTGFILGMVSLWSFSGLILAEEL